MGIEMYTMAGQTSCFRRIQRTLDDDVKLDDENDPFARASIIFKYYQT